MGIYVGQADARRAVGIRWLSTLALSIVFGCCAFAAAQADERRIGESLAYDVGGNIEVKHWHGFESSSDTILMNEVPILGIYNGTIRSFPKCDCKVHSKLGGLKLAVKNGRTEEAFFRPAESSFYYIIYRLPFSGDNDELRQVEYFFSSLRPLGLGAGGPVE